MQVNKKIILIPELKVSDFRQSLDFYTRIAGFEVLYDRPEEEFVMLSKNGASIMIESLSKKTRTWEAGILEKPFGRGMHFQIEVSDIGILYHKFRNAKWPIFAEMEEKWYRVKDKNVGNKQFLVQDPDGYLFRFFQDLGIK